MWLNACQLAAVSKRHLTYLILAILAEFPGICHSADICMDKRCNDAQSLKGICGIPDVQLNSAHSRDTYITLCNSFIQLGKKQVKIPNPTSASEGAMYRADTFDEYSNKSSEAALNGTGNETGVDIKSDGVSDVAAKLVVAMMLAGIVISAIILAMTHSKNLNLSSLSTSALETTLAFFIGVLWFQAINSLIDKKIRKRDHQVGVSIGNAVFWLLVFLVLAWIVRHRRKPFAIVTGCCAYIAAFFGLHAAYITQKYYYSEHWMDCLHGICVLFVCMALLFSLCYLLKLVFFQDPGGDIGDHHVSEWADSMDNMEAIFFGMAVAFVVTEFIRFKIACEFPQLKGTSYKTTHTNMERHLLLGWVVAVAAIGGFIVWYLTSMETFARRSYGIHRVVGLICCLLSMCIAWAFLDWGQWYFYEWTDFGPIFARIMFALICCAVWILGVCLLAFVRTANSKFCDFGILTLSLIVAWSWGQVFELAFDKVFKQWWAKLAVALLVSALVIPVISFLLRPALKHFPAVSEPIHEKDCRHEQDRQRPKHEPKASALWSPPMSTSRVDMHHPPDSTRRIYSPSPMFPSPVRSDLTIQRSSSPLPDAMVRGALPSTSFLHRPLPSSRIQSAPFALHPY